VRPHPLRSDGSQTWSVRSGTSEYRNATWPCLNQNRIQIEVWNLFWSKTSKNLNFCSVDPKIANDTSLESLECIESNDPIKPIILWDYFESIVRSELTLWIRNKFITSVL
jgi:hypothetical protein